MSDWSDSFRDWYYNYEPDAGYAQWMKSLGQLTIPFRSYLYSLYPRYQTDYKAVAAEEPTLSWTDFLRRQDPYKDYFSMSPQQRGEAPDRFTPRVRWVGF